MRIVYIHPEGYQKRYSEVVIPVGMVGIMNMLLDYGYDVTAVNIPLEMRLNEEFDTLAYFRENKYDVYMVELHWYIYSYHAIELSKYIKSINPDSTIVLGGMTATKYNIDIMKNYDFVDFIISGDSENSYIAFLSEMEKDKRYYDVCNLTFRSGNRIIENQVECISKEQFDKMNYSNYSWLNNKDYFFRLQAHEDLLHDGTESRLAWLPIARGCMYDCSYCGGNKTFFEKEFNYNSYKIRSIDSVIFDMQQLKSIGVNKIGVTHDLSIFGNAYWKELFDRIEENDFNFSIFHYCFQLPCAEFIKRMNNVFSQDGSVVGIPVITGDEEKRRLNGKLFFNRDLLETLDAFIGSKTIVSLYFIDNAVGCEGSTFEKTKEFIIALVDRYSKHINLEVGYGFELLQPASKVYRGEFEKDGIMPLWTSFNDIYQRLSPQFQTTLHRERNMEMILGQTTSDRNLLFRYKHFNRLIEEKGLNYIKEV